MRQRARRPHGHAVLASRLLAVWTRQRQAAVEQHAKYGQVYNVGSPEDLMEMVKREDIILSMPHPRTKNNTGYPDGYKDKWFFKDPHDRQIISTTEASGFGQRHFEIPFDATGKKWVRFAAWDIAGNGALVQPIKLNAAPATITK